MCCHYTMGEGGEINSPSVYYAIRMDFVKSLLFTNCLFPRKQEENTRDTHTAMVTVRRVANAEIQHVNCASCKPCMCLAQTLCVSHNCCACHTAPRVSHSTARVTQPTTQSTQKASPDNARRGHIDQYDHTDHAILGKQETLPMMLWIRVEQFSYRTILKHGTNSAT